MMVINFCRDFCIMRLLELFRKRGNWSPYSKSISAGYEQQLVEFKNGESSRRPTRKRGPPQRLQDCEVLMDNKINNVGDLIHFAVMAESKPVSTKEALSDPKWL